MKEEMLIKLYLKYLNRPEDYMKDYQKTFSELENEIKVLISNLSINTLVDLYCKYSGITYIRENLNMDNFFEMLLKKILSKFDSLSPIEMIDLYAKVYNETLIADSSRESNEFVVSNRTNRLSQEYYINQIKDLKSYKETLELYKNDIKYYQKCFEVLDNLQNSIFERLVFNIEKLSATDSEELLVFLNTKAETNHEEIVRRNLLSANQKYLKLERDFKDITLYEQQKALDTTALKNDNEVYKTFINSLSKSLGKSLK